MNDCNGHEGLLLIIGELLLQESIASRSDGLKGRSPCPHPSSFPEAATSTCSCGIGGQLPFVRYMVRLREAEFASCRGCSFSEIGEIISVQLETPRNTIGHPPIVKLFYKQDRT